MVKSWLLGGRGTGSIPDTIFEKIVKIFQNFPEYSRIFWNHPEQIGKYNIKIIIFFYFF